MAELSELSPEAQAVLAAEPDGISAALNAAADQLPTSTPHPYPSQIYYNGCAMAANLLRTWAAELNQSES
jgi:hypothetical protein